MASVLFGSCNRQNLPQPHWHKMLEILASDGSQQPEYFFWLGDAVYARNRTLEGLSAAYTTLKNNGYYERFIKQLYIDGIWDDHDLGINDAGKFTPDILERASMYIQFLNQGRIVTRKNPASRIQEKGGLYHTRIMKNRNSGGGVAKFIFLDTRFNRDHHYVRSLGEIKLPFTALFAAAFRAFYSILGFGTEYSGDILGEKQWAWLESELSSDPKRSKEDDKTPISKHLVADYHVIISSIQVFTSNPAVESWGHFPVARRRLVEMLERIEPSGLAFLSGDVHHAETITIKGNSHEAESTNIDAGGLVKNGQWSEITSSGLTHSASDGLLNSILCPLMLSTFSSHRIAAMGDATFAGKNFGSLQFDKHSMNVSVRDLTSGRIALTRTIYPSSPTGTFKAQIDPFPVLSLTQLTLVASALLFLLSLTCCAGLYRRGKILGGENGQKKKK